MSVIMKESVPIRKVVILVNVLMVILVTVAIVMILTNADLEAMIATRKMEFA